MKSLSSILTLWLLQFGAAQAVVYVDGSSSDWTPMMGNFDYHEDQQTGNAPVSQDIVGDNVDGNYGFLVAFNDDGDVSAIDGTIGFRVRLDAPDVSGNQTPAYDYVVWVGIDADNSGSLDVFLSANFHGNNNQLEIRAAGDDFNNSPNTTSIANDPYKTYAIDTVEDVTPANYNYRAVQYNTGMMDGGTTNDVTLNTSGDPDYYVSFMIPFTDIVTFLSELDTPINIDDTSELRFIIATSTNPNALNQDIGGLPRNFDGDDSWEDLGGFTPPFIPVPEPSSTLLLLGSIAGGCLIRRRR